MVQVLVLLVVMHRHSLVSLSVSSVKLLKKDRNSSPESMNRLPQMAKHLEVSLYRNARSFEAYTDMNTLKQRLHQIAAEVSRKARPQQPEASRDDRQHHPGGASDRPLSSYGSQNGMRGGSTSPYMGGMSMSNGGSSGGRMMNMEEINPMSTSGGPQGYHQPTSSRMSQPHPPPPPQQQQQRPIPSQNQNQNRNDPEWKLRIRHKQQRLLLLHHSAKCSQKGHCSVTPHCADMKRLWRHMEGCKDNHCRVAHCFSSRAILSHYRKCKDPACPACGPVRETVRKAQSTSRGANPSTGPLMNAMRGPSSQPMVPPQQSMATPSTDAMSQMSVGSFGSGSAPSHPQQRSSPAMHSAMPPPGSGPPGSEKQYTTSSQYPRPGSAGSGQPSSAVQPLYNSDQQSGDGRGQSSLSLSSSQQHAKDALSTSMPASTRPPGSSESEWQKIRHKQQRLLLLRHASRCQHDVGTCPVTPHCASMKKLWEHIAHCKNQQCKVQHCLSSRYVLSHYRRCKNARCPSCGPVRDSIRRSTAREKKMEQQTTNSNIPSFDSGTSFHAPPELPSAPTPPPPDVSSTPAAPVVASSAPPSTSPELSYEPERKRVKTDDAPSVTSSSSMTVTASNQSGAVAEPVKEVKQHVTQPVTVPSKKIEPAEASKVQNADYPLLNSFSLEHLETHLASLDRKTQLPPAKLKTKCVEVLKGLQSHQHGWVFNCPVDPVELGLPDYFEIIKKPMDLGSIQKKLDVGGYHEIKDFESDSHLCFDNAMTYNENGSVVYGMAKELKVKFEGDMKKLMSQLEEEDMQRRQNDRACTLCGCEKLMFEPPVYFCNGMNCQSQRIRRNNNFYIGGNNQYFWCSACFNELDDKIPIELVDMTIMKKDMRKKRNDEVHEESWVQCDTCERWVHQICGLFNTRQNKEHQSEYCCPRCLRDKRRASDATPSSSPPGADDLPRTTTSEWLEKHIAKRVERRKRELAEEKAKNEVCLLTV
jgi:hypothetical protein